jgi:hypothetical protein
MNFLKRLFSGGGSVGSDTLYIYIKPKMCNQVLQLEIDTKQQLSLNDSEDGYWVRKIANTPRCPFEAEVILHFDKNKNLIDREISNGEFVTEQVYQDFLDSQPKASVSNGAE